jgi:urease subunit beta
MKEQDIGFFRLKDQPVTLNKGRKYCELEVTNEGERTIQIGSHFHFFEVNKSLVFERESAFGMYLDIPSGTAVRFEPGKTVKVRLTEYSGEQIILGFNGLTNGCIKDESVKEASLNKALRLGYIKEVKS